MTALASKMAGSKAVPKPRKEPDTKRYAGRVAVRLRELRTLRRLTQEQLAEKLTKSGYPISTPTVYAWENGNLQVQIDALPYVAKVLQVTVGQFMPEK